VKPLFYMSAFFRTFPLLLVFGMNLIGQEPPIPPDAPEEPQAFWPVQPRRKPLVSHVFTSHMVLQRDVPVPIWGWAPSGEKVRVHIVPAEDAQRMITVESVADRDGKWMARVGPFKASAALKLVVERSGERVEMDDVLVGDVWLCSGQSNMNWPVRLSLDAEREMSAANHPTIRSLTVPFCPSYVPLKTMEPTRWEVCTPQTVGNFSGVGYFFAREIAANQRIPIGIIHSSVGATTAEVWVSPSGLRKRMPHDFHEQLATLEKKAGEGGDNYFEACARWMESADSAKRLPKELRASMSTLSGWEDVAVPKAWEQSGLDGFDGLVFFRTEVDVPEGMAGKRAVLALGQINDVDVSWVNGELVGVTQIKGQFRRYELEAGVLRPGLNQIAVAVLNRAGPGGLVAATPKHLTLRFEGESSAIELGPVWKRRVGSSLTELGKAFPKPKLGYYKTLCGMDNGMIEPLVPFAIKGVLWYQGEASWPFWQQYRRLLPALIGDWRERFQVGDFPFLQVQLSTQGPKQKNPIEPGYGEIRESQWRTAKSVPNTGMAVSVDIGDEPVSNIHPKNKQEVGRRLSLVARRMVYGEQLLESSGPEYCEMMLERIPTTDADAPKRFRNRLYFKHVGGGLVLRKQEGAPSGFAVSEDDKVYHWADAAVEGETVVVTSSEVAVPRYVRYAWAYNPVVTLFNKEGMPAIPFRTVE
jgi:sialate O-acetylesterase